MSGYYVGPPERRGVTILLVGALATLGIVVVLLVLALAFRVGPFGPSTTRLPDATADATSRPTLPPPATDEPTARPTDLPTQPPTPAGPAFSPGDPATAELLEHVPRAIRASCAAVPAVAPIEATLTCTLGDIAVSYTAYVDRESLQAAYELSFDEAQIEPDTGRCYESDGGLIVATPNHWPAEHRYSVAGNPRGRYLCVEREAPSIVWTDERLDILAVAVGSSEQRDELVRAWITELGPVP